MQTQTLRVTAPSGKVPLTTGGRGRYDTTPGSNGLLDTGSARLIGSHSLAKFSFEISGNSN